MPRAFALLTGPLWMLLVSQYAERQSGMPLWAVLPVVVAAAVVVMGVLTAFGAKAFRCGDRQRRFSLSTLLLLVLLLSIYLGMFRWFVGLFPAERRSAAFWWDAAVTWALFFIVSVTFLFLYAEALIWLALTIARCVARLRRSGASSK